MHTEHHVVNAILYVRRLGTGQASACVEREVGLRPLTPCQGFSPEDLCSSPVYWPFPPCSVNLVC